MRNIITGLLLLFLAVPSLGAVSTHQYRCIFPTFSDQSAAQQTQKNDFTGVYIVSTQEDGSQTGMLSGSIGASELIVLPGVGILNLLEITPVGIINITTLQPDFEAGTALAVHSRHIAAPVMNMWSPTQWYGDCVIQ
jgi:hypothetical protein